MGKFEMKGTERVGRHFGHTPLTPLTPPTPLTLRHTEQRQTEKCWTKKGIKGLRNVHGQDTYIKTNFTPSNYQILLVRKAIY